MKPSQPLDTLQALARNRSEAALASLGTALAASRTSDERLALLERYRNEYRLHLATAERDGVSITSLTNHRAFLERLESAISQAAEDAVSRRASAQADASRWHAERRKEKSLEVLVDRRTLKARTRAERQNQKQTDEVAARVAGARDRS